MIDLIISNYIKRDRSLRKIGLGLLLTDGGWPRSFMGAGKVRDTSTHPSSVEM